VRSNSSEARQNNRPPECGQPIDAGGNWQSCSLHAHARLLRAAKRLVPQIYHQTHNGERCEQVNYNIYVLEIKLYFSEYMSISRNSKVAPFGRKLVYGRHFLRFEMSPKMSFHQKCQSSTDFSLKIITRLKLSLFWRVLSERQNVTVLEFERIDEYISIRNSFFFKM
jgi:hypothetical protein